MKFTSPLQAAQFLFELYGFSLEQLSDPDPAGLTLEETEHTEAHAPLKTGNAVKDLVHFERYLWHSGIRLSSPMGRWLLARYRAKEAGLRFDN